jgi:chloramphenicol 3-O phosphotransferase
MEEPTKPGQIIILNGTPRGGKSSTAAAIQETFEGPWINLGVDGFKRMTAARYQPAIGIRPGGEREDLEPLITVLYAAMYESIAAHSRLGVNVVVDVGHHDSYATPRGILIDCAKRLTGLPVLFVGLRCPIEIIMERRRNTWENTPPMGDPIPDPVLRWQREVHIPGIYDLEIDTSTMSPQDCAEVIHKYLKEGPSPTAFEQLAEMDHNP